MTAPALPPLVTEEEFLAALKAGCKESDAHLTCSYPECACKVFPRAFTAAIAALQPLLTRIAMAEREAVLNILEAKHARLVRHINEHCQGDAPAAITDRTITEGRLIQLGQDMTSIRSRTTGAKP